jgi:hypothetical protein
MKSFDQGGLVRIIAGGWTIDQRRKLWIVEGSAIFGMTWIHQRSDPNYRVAIRSDHIASVTALDLIVSALNEEVLCPPS